jgi:hypothetical protein
VRTIDLLFYCLLVVVPTIALRPFVMRHKDGSVGVFVPGALAYLLGALGFFVARGIQLLVKDRLAIEVPREGTSDFVSAAYAFLVIGPLEESLRAAAVAPALRSKELTRPYDAMRVAAGAALGFATCAAAWRVWGEPASFLLSLRVVCDLIAHVSLTSIWGFALGRERRRRLGGSVFTRTFLVAVAFSSLTTHLVFGRGPNALWAALPLVLSAALVALVARRDLLRMSDASRQRRLSRLLPVSPPTLEELEQALLRRPDRPLMLRWIGFGALVTTGVLTALVATSVAIGHGAGVDFAAVDRDTSFDRSAPPLVLLGTALLGAFPISGFLVARASGARGVLEPALAAAAAIVVLVVLLGLAAPVAVVFGLALGPVAFALACAGAWAGVER